MNAGSSTGSSTGTSTGTATGTSTGTSSGATSASSYLKQAAADYTDAQNALASGNLGEYQDDVNAMNAELKLAQTALAKSS